MKSCLLASDLDPMPTALRIRVQHREMRTHVDDYIASAIDWNATEVLSPSAVTAVIITTAMSAAIKPYSIAVAPDSFLKNFSIGGLHILPFCPLDAREIPNREASTMRLSKSRESILEKL